MNKKPTMSRLSKSVLTFGLLFVVFAFGVGIGNGRIRFGRLSELAQRQTGTPSSVQKNLPQDLDYQSVEKVYDQLRQNFDGQLDQTTLLDGLKSGLAAAAGDPYTEYMSVDAAKDFNNQLDGTFSGIGAELSKDADGNIIVISPISGYPADKAGLKPKDVIAEIDGTSTAGMTVSDAVTKIRGETGTQVKLKIVRNQSQVLDLEITREQITIPSVESKTLDGNIGYIKISRFGEDTTQLVTVAAEKFKAAGIKGVVVDVRGDPGGLLDSAVDVASLWLEQGKTVLLEKRDGKITKTYRATGKNPLKDVPTIVLINDGSASASEILAGALHDNGVARLFGEKSFGKGSVQRVIELGDGSVLKVTIAKWFTPNDVNINKEGIKPDTEVKLSDDDAKNQRDPQLDAAQSALR